MVLEGWGGGGEGASSDGGGVGGVWRWWCWRGVKVVVVVMMAVEMVALVVVVVEVVRGAVRGADVQHQPLPDTVLLHSLPCRSRRSLVEGAWTSRVGVVVSLLRTRRIVCLFDLSLSKIWI